MSERFHWLDAWRGAAVWLMLVYHFLFDFVFFGWLELDFFQTWPMIVFERVVAYSFILCAGISAVLTRSNAKRGLIVLLAGGLVTAVSYAVGAPIKFGVLQFLGLSMLLYALVGEYIKRLPEKLEPVLWLALFILTQLITDAVTVKVRWLFWLGFLYDGFTSFDYFPMLPNFFLFLLGAWAGRALLARRGKLPILRRKAPAILTWPGRRSLIIYILHQPVLFGACLAFYALT